MSGIASFQQQYWTKEQVEFFNEVARLSGFTLFAVPKDFGRIIGVAYWLPDAERGERERQGFLITDDLRDAEDNEVTPDQVAGQLNWLWRNERRTAPDQVLWDREFAIYQNARVLKQKIKGSGA